MHNLFTSVWTRGGKDKGFIEYKGLNTSKAGTQS